MKNLAVEVEEGGRKLAELAWQVARAQEKRAALVAEVESGQQEIRR